MKFTLTVEETHDEDAAWEAKIAEFPDVRGYSDNAIDAAKLAVEAAIELTFWNLEAPSPDQTTDGQ
jgi:hypothetical protein